MRNLTPWAAICGLAIAAQLPARADTVDTFTFTQPVWYQVPPGDYTYSDGYYVADPSSTPDPGGVLSGTFTGTVDSTGRIQLADLSAFSATYSDSAFGTGDTQGLADLALFSYDTQGGAGSLDFDFNFNGATGYCVGAAVVLDALCTNDLTAVYPAGAVGALFNIGTDGHLAAALSFTAPTVTLVSSVTMPLAVPEPSTPMLLATGVAVLLELSMVREHRRSRARRFPT
jgi:hypothetical protein